MPPKTLPASVGRKKRNSSRIGPDEPGHHAVDRLDAAGNDVRKAEERDQVREQRDDEKIDALGGSENPHHRRDEPAGSDAFGEHFPRRVAHDVRQDYGERGADIGRNDRQECGGERENQTAGHVRGKDDAPKAQHLDEPRDLLARHHRQHGGQHVLSEQLLMPEDDNQKADRIAELGDDRAPFRNGQMRGKGGFRQE